MKAQVFRKVKGKKTYLGEPFLLVSSSSTKEFLSSLKESTEDLMLEVTISPGMSTIHPI